jgi:phosphoribosylaminoimidazole-succinocarboxamide synthase
MPAVADLKLHSSGKVREIYEWEDDLLMVASDRISIYDVVMPTPIPDKGKVLNRISEFWFELTGDIVPNHFLSDDVPEEVAERAMRVRRLEMYPVECVVRGYLSGSGWKEYRQSGSVCGIELPPNLLESDKLPEPIFTPATKAEIGDHDENVDFERAAEIVGDRALMEELRRISIDVYERGAEHAAERGNHPRRHQVRARSPRRRRDRPRRRGADPRLLALLAGRPLRAGEGPTVLRQAVRARLGRRRRLGPQAAGARAAGRRDRADAGQVR